MAEVNVHGLRELNRLFTVLGKDAKKELRNDLREIAEPIRADAEQIARQRISRVGVRWSRMRIGVTQRAVYVAPRQRGVPRRNPRSRPPFAPILDSRAMTPALDQNKAGLERKVEATFDELARKWNRKG